MFVFCKILIFFQLIANLSEFFFILFLTFRNSSSVAMVNVSFANSSSSSHDRSANFPSDSCF